MVEEEYSIIIRDGFIVDGTRNPWFKTNIGVKGTKITRIGRIKTSAKRIIDAKGLIVSPGFIDMHSHSDLALLRDPLSEPKIRQGVTMEILGQDGLSVAPVEDEDKQTLQKFLSGLAGDFEEWDWNSLSDYLERIEERGTAVNVATYVGHGTIRVAIMGYEDRKPSKRELDEMKHLTERSMLDGAFGLSSGLIYAPSCYADACELIELNRVVAKYSGIYVTHLRGEGETLLEALKEAIYVVREAGIPLHVSHHKVVGRKNWGRVDETLRMIDEERERGLDITCDQYPYTAGSTMLSALIPPWGHQGGVERLIERLKDEETRKKLREDMISGLPDWTGSYRAAGWKNILVTYCKKNKDIEGKSIIEIAESKDKDPFDTVFDIIIEEKAASSMVLFYISERDMFKVMRHPAVMVATDGLLSGKPHPRAYGTYAKILGRYVREEKKLPLEEAIRKMTSFPAERLGLWNRGLLREGMYADITIFDSKKIIDRATYEKPHQYPEGVLYVLVNGEIALEKGQRNRVLSGKVLRKNQTARA